MLILSSYPFRSFSRSWRTYSVWLWHRSIPQGLSCRKVGQWTCWMFVQRNCSNWNWIFFHL